MSRCFPFPPPGYEKKLRLENVNLLAKEKEKVKKENRHKKDKEKKAGREKHEENDKEKRKHKDKDKKNGKKRSRHGKSFEGDRSNVEKVGSTSPQSSCVQEVEQRTNSVGGAIGSQTVDEVYDTDQGKAERLDGVASRSNGAYWSEVKCGLEPMAKKQRDNSHSNAPKTSIVFGNGADQRTVQMVRAAENNFNKLAEGKVRKKHHNSSKEGEKSKDKNAKRHKEQAKIFTPQTFGCSGLQIDPPKDAAFVQELERRSRDENGATGSQVGIKSDVTRKIVQNPVISANGYAISFSQMKENSRFRNGSFSTENGPKDNDQFKVPKVSIVQNLKVEERGSVVKSTNVAVEGVKKNGYSGNVVVDNRKKIKSKDEDQYKPREEKVKEEASSIVELSRFGHNGSDSTSSSNQMTFKLGYKNAGLINGKQKMPEANAIHDTETRPEQLQKIVPFSQPAAQNGRHLKSSTTITVSAPKQGPANGFKLDADEHKTTSTVCSQSTSVTINSLSTSLKPMGTSPLGTMKTPISTEANRNVGVKGTPPGVTAFQESSLTVGKVNIIHEAVGCQIPVKLPLTAGKVNVAIGAHGSPPVILKRPSISGKEKRKDKSSSKTLPPHPDTKYLSQLLSLPKMDELSTFDDSEWLFERKRVPSKEGDVGYDKDKVEQVWAKFIHVDSAEVYARPYVIPY